MNFSTISAPCTASFIEKRSEFIAALAPVQTPEEAIAHVNAIREQHRKARHNPYAYILRADNTTRYSDDGEPQGTAGTPILDVLQKQGLTDVCCVVTRYFGGILLGGGGLVRAYSHAASLSVSAAVRMEMCACRTLELTVDYTLYGKLTFALPQFSVIIQNTDFGDCVTMTLLVLEEKFEPLCAHLTNLTCGAITYNQLDEGYADFSSVLSLATEE
ncbi:MAG: YigZ family protein [Ruminococcus sp.]|nr:YigZ family protein [Ruminococcus sp.]